MLEKIIDLEKATLDQNGIWIVKNESQVDQTKRAAVNNCDLEALLKRKTEDFVANKLSDHWENISRIGVFNDQTVFLEIGCWPAYIGEYSMATFNSYFVGVDFNYARLLTLKKSFEKKGYTKYIFICADINYIPIKNNSVDYVYGGGVIEHLRDTRKIINELFRVLKPGGTSYNTVPALNFWWLTRFYNTIPDVPILKRLFEIIIFNFFGGRIMERHHGYQQAFTRSRLKKLHRNAGFREISTGPFAFHVSTGRLKSAFLRELLYQTRRISFLTAIYFVCGKK